MNLDNQTSALRAVLEAEYGIVVRSIEPLGAAQSARVFLVTLDDDTRRVAKISLWYGFAPNPRAALEKAHAVAEKIAHEGIGVQTAYRRVNGDFVATFDGNPLVLLRYIEGSAFTGRAAEFTAAGEALGRYHAAGRAILAREPEEANDIRARIPFEKSYEESRAAFAALKERLMYIIDDEPAELAVARAALPQLESLMQSIDDSFVYPLTETIVHGDFGAPNALYDENGSVAGIIDVDQLGIGACITDIAITLGSLATEFTKTRTLQEFHSMAVIFLRAYHGVHPLPREEYERILAANHRWDIMRILRILRRHFEGGGAFQNPLDKMATRFIPRLSLAHETFAFSLDDIFPA
ncbi:hypothetical protein FJY94_05335 [Candidatus Kaiserbacteria bacterium]|nr:hypothetical protein [Candidatus Kaiserbacteria bacterium]